jgi:hypothetical protein
LFHNLSEPGGIGPVFTVLRRMIHSSERF